MSLLVLALAAVFAGEPPDATVVVGDPRFPTGARAPYPPRPAPPLTYGPDRPPPPAGRTCGGIAALACPRGQVCRYPAGRPYPDRAGVCVARRPQACTREYRPVCAFNGRTYANRCEATRAGARVRREGSCRRR